MSPVLGRTLITYLLATVATGATGVILLPIYTRALGPAAYGELDLGLAMATLLVSLGVAGLDTALGIAWFRDATATRPALATAALGAAFIAALVASAIGAVIGLPVVARLAQGMSLTPAAVLIACTSAATVLRIGQTLLRQTFRAQAFLLVALVQAVVTVGVGLAAVLAAHAGSVGAAVAYGAGWICSVVATLALLRPDRHASGVLAAARRLFRLGLPVAPAGIAIWLYALVDRFIVAYYSGPVDLGLYAASARMAAILGLFVAAGQLAWGPLAMSVSARRGSDGFYAAALLVFSAASAATVVLTAVLAPAVVPLVLGGDYGPASPVLWLLVGGLLANGAYYIVAIGLNIAERTGDIGRSTWLAAIVNVTLNLALIPSYGYFGAAVATFIAYGVAAAAVYVWAQRAHPIPYPVLTVAALWIIGVVTAAAWVTLDVAPRAAALAAGLIVGAAVAVNAGLVHHLRWAVRFAAPASPGDQDMLGGGSAG